MSTIQLEKIVLNGYKFMSNSEFELLDTYVNNITYFIYDENKDSVAPATYKDTSGATHNVSRYAMKADRCICVGPDGSINEIYEVTNSYGDVAYRFGTDVVMRRGPNDSVTVHLPVSAKYGGLIADLPNTSNRYFLGWFRGDERITGNTIIQSGDVLTARFTVAGDYTHPFGYLFSLIGKWEYSSNGFDMTYSTTYEHEASHLRISVSASYDFDSDTVTKSTPEVSYFGLGDSPELKNELDDYTLSPIRTDNQFIWYSAYGWKLTVDRSTMWTRFEWCTDKTESIFVFMRPYSSLDTDYAGVSQTIYLGKGTGYIYKLRNDGTEIGISSAPYGSTSAVSTAPITWQSTDTGVLILRGSWEYIGVGTTAAQAKANMTARPLMSVPMYAAKTTVAYGFGGINDNGFAETMDVIGVRNAFSTVGTSSTTSAFAGSVSCRWLIFADELTTTTGGFQMLTMAIISIEKLKSIANGWGNGAKYFSRPFVNMLGCVAIQNLTAASSRYLLTGNTKAYTFEVRNSPKLTGATNAVYNFETANIVSYEEGGIIIIGGFPTFPSGCLYNFSGVIWFKDIEIETVQQYMGSSGYSAANNAVFGGKDGRAYKFNKTGTEPIDRFAYRLIN